MSIKRKDLKYQRGGADFAARDFDRIAKTVAEKFYTRLDDAKRIVAKKVTYSDVRGLYLHKFKTEYDKKLRGEPHMLVREEIALKEAFKSLKETDGDYLKPDNLLNLVSQVG